MTRRSGSRVRALLIACSTLIAAGCIGATDRADFDAEVRSRGGGVSTDWIDGAFDLVATELAVRASDEIEVLTLSINASNRSLVVQGRRGDRPNFVDSVTVVEGEVVDVRPMQDADDLPLDEITVRLADLPIEKIETISDEATAALGEADAFVTRIAVNLVNSVHELRVFVESARQTGHVVFDLDGNLVEVDT